MTIIDLIDTYNDNNRHHGHSQRHGLSGILDSLLPTASRKRHWETKDRRIVITIY